MSGYDKIVRSIPRQEIEQRACAWREALGCRNAWVVDLAHILEMQIPRLLPAFAVRVRRYGDMPDDEARTFHSVPSIDLREDVYNGLIRGQPRYRFTAAHELGHLFLHEGESRPRAVNAVAARTIPRSQSSEGQADDFAASFLMPEHVARQFDNPMDLATNCAVSLAAAQNRMRELRLWPKARPPVPEVEEFLRLMRERNKR